MRNKVYFQKIRVIAFTIKHAFFTGWYRSYDNAGEENAPHSPRSLAHFKLQMQGRNALRELLK